MNDLSEYLDRTVVLRRPASHEQFPDTHVCPECGNIIESTKGPQNLAPVDRLVDDDDREVLEGAYTQQFPTFGYVCTQHNYTVLTPYPVSNERASGFIDGWVGVPIRFADESVLHIPVPEVELEALAEAGDDGGVEA